MKIYDAYVIKNYSSLAGKTIIVTGANGGVGYYISHYILTLGGNLIMACRNLERAKEAKNRLLKAHKDGAIKLEYLDLSKFATIHDFVSRMKNHKIDILINNAGVYHLQPQVNTDGIEIHFATNALGNFILTTEFLPLLASTKGKIIQVSSISYRFTKFILMMYLVIILKIKPNYTVERKKLQCFLCYT